MDRKIIRKLVLQEVRRKIIAEEQRVLMQEGFFAAAGVALGVAGVAAAVAGAGAVYLNYFKKMPVDQQIEAILTDAAGKATATPPGNLYLANQAVADALLASGDLDIPAASDVKVAQQKLSDAFQGTIEKIAGIDINTEEGEVTDIINKSKSQLGFAKICASYTLDGRNMLVVLKDEMSNYDFIEYVEKPLMALPFALASDGTPLTAAQFASLQPPTPRVQLGYGCDAKPAVKHIIDTLNSYNSSRSIGSQVTGTKWSTAVQASWMGVCAHAVLNEPIFADYSPAGGTKVVGGSMISDWKKVSNVMIGEFPGYTPDAPGMLAFLIDAYYGEIRCGDKTGAAGPAAAAAGAGGAGGGGGGGKPEEEADDKDQKGDRTYSEIGVRVISGEGNANLSEVFDPTVENDFIEVLEGNFKEDVQRSTVRAGTMQVDVIFNGRFTKVRRVRRRRPIGGRPRQNFKGNLQRTIDEFFNPTRLAVAGPDKLERYSDKKRMRIQITIPANYTMKSKRRK